MSSFMPKQNIGNLCELINGRAFKPEDWGTVGLPIVRIQNLNDAAKPFNYFDGEYSEKHFVRSGEILLSWSGTPGTSFGCFKWDRCEALLNQHIFKVKADEKLILPEFFMHAMNYKLDEMIDLAHGAAGLRHITKAKLVQIELPVPTIPKQHQLVKHINECFERVAEIRSLRVKSLKEAQVLLGAVVEDIFREAGGDEVSLTEVATIEGKLVDPRETAFKNMLHVGGANIVSETGELIKMQTAEEEKLISGKFVFNDKDVLYSKIRPYLKKVARPDFIGLCSADMYPLRPAEGRLHRDYLFFLLLSRDFTNYAIKVSNRAGMPKVNREQLFAYRFNLPSYQKQTDVIEKLNESMQAVLAMVAEMKAAVSESDFIQQSILKKAFAGEL